MNRLVIMGSPVARFVTLTAYCDGKQHDSVGILPEDLGEVTLDYLLTYNINHIDLVGNRSYMEGFEKRIREAETTNYSLANVTFCYV